MPDVTPADLHVPTDVVVSRRRRRKKKAIRKHGDKSSPTYPLFFHPGGGSLGTKTVTIHASELQPGDNFLDGNDVHTVLGVSERGTRVAVHSRSLTTNQEKKKSWVKSAVLRKILMSIAAIIAVLNIGQTWSDYDYTDTHPSQSPHTVSRTVEVPSHSMLPAPRTAAGYTKLWASLDPKEWGGGDVSLSVGMPDGRSVWLYGDTFSSGRFVHSSAIVQDGGSLHVSHAGAQLLPNDDASHIYWIEQAKAVGNSSIQVTAAPMVIGKAGSWDFKRANVKSRTAIVDVAANGDVTFKRWTGYVTAPKQATDFTVIGPHHFTYDKRAHPEIKLANGKTLYTVNQNWDDGKLRPPQDYAPIFSEGPPVTIAKAHFNPNEPRRWDGQWVRNVFSGKEVQRQLPRDLTLAEHQKLQTWVNENFDHSTGEHTYASIVARLMRKGIGQHPSRRKSISDRYNISPNRQVEIEAAVHNHVFAPKGKPRNVHTFIDRSTRAQIKTLGEIATTRRAHVMGDGKTRLVKATKGTKRGKWVFVDTKGQMRVSRMSDTSAQKMIDNAKKQLANLRAVEMKREREKAPKHPPAQTAEEKKRLAALSPTNIGRHEGKPKVNRYLKRKELRAGPVKPRRNAPVPGLGRHSPPIRLKGGGKRADLITPEDYKGIEKAHFNPNELRDPHGRWTLTAKAAYDKGWNASKNTKTYDLGEAESRFESKYGSSFSHHFSNGWIDYAADHEKYHSHIAKAHFDPHEPRDWHGRWIELGGGSAHKFAGVFAHDDGTHGLYLDKKNTPVAIYNSKLGAKKALQRHIDIGNGIERRGRGRPKGSGVGTKVEFPGSHKATAKEIADYNAHQISYQEKIPPTATEVYLANNWKTNPKLHGKYKVSTNPNGQPKYLYSDWWNQQQAEKKHQRVTELLKKQNIGVLHRAISNDHKTDDNAAALALALHLGMRVGSNRTRNKAGTVAFGSTNLQKRHVQINRRSKTVTFDFVAKGGKHHGFTTAEPAVYEVMAHRHGKAASEDTPLFPRASDEGARKYLASILPGFKVHDLRTAKANVLALQVAKQMTPPKSRAEYRQMRNAVGDYVGEKIGDTRKVTLDKYINPALFATIWPGSEAWA